MRFLRLFLFLSLIFIANGDNSYTFESKTGKALWTFLNSEQIADSFAEAQYAHLTGTLYTPVKKPVNKDDNFRVVVGSGQNQSNHYAYYSSQKPASIVPMLASAYFQHTASSCELVFRHRVHGVPGSELVVTTQHLPREGLLREHEENEVHNEDASDWVTPTSRAHFKPISDGDERWTKSRVSIGQTLYPTRIRIECHSAQNQRDLAMQNVECNVDDITLVNCDEELWEASACSSKQTKKYLCSKHGAHRCIDYADVCDLHPECEGDEDEDNTLHKCMNVPAGARCDFECASETGCPQWRFFSPNFQSSVSNSSNQYLQLMSFDDKRLPSHGVPPAEFTYHGNKRVPGHFLFFSTHSVASDNQPNGDIVYTYAVSPTFPPTPISTSMPELPSFQACMVRFFFCHSGTATFQLVREWGSDFSYQKDLWTSAQSAGSDPCVWQKASAVIPYQNNEYRLKIVFGKLDKQSVSVAIDDFTMTPNCFHESTALQTHFAPDRLLIKNCNKKEGECPTSNGELNSTVVVENRGPWFVRQAGTYRVELYGGAGGQLPGQRANNRGGVILINLRLQRGQSLGFVAGNAGTSPCDHDKREIEVKPSASLDRLWRVICNENSTVEELEVARRDAQNLFGTSGGGASALYVDEKLLAVAGAGGGVFPESFALLEHPATTSAIAAGGHLIEDVNLTTISNLSTISTDNWSAGDGASFSPMFVGITPEVEWPRCPNCTQMFGRQALSAVHHFIGGSCPSDRLWNVIGGNGGGGAACGPGTGGGAGFIGGSSGHKRDANGGSSAVLISDALVAWSPGVHKGDGHVLLLRCTLGCPESSACEFEPPVVGEEAIEFCLCENGKRLHLHTQCGAPEGAPLFKRFTFWISELTDLDPKYVSVILYILLGIFLVVAVSAFILFLIFNRSNWLTRWLQKHVKCCRTEKPDLLNDMVEMKCVHNGAVWSRTSTGNRITSNPIYERLSVGDLPQIPRNDIKLVKSIGNGAFGEVYDALLTVNEESHRVAVKTLLLDSTSGSECDFHIEARMLHQLVHKNIIKFYGVAFEDLPNYIVIEFMEGGDMRAFLRDSRPQSLTPIHHRNSLLMLDLLRMALDVANGGEYLERTKFVHRDLAARNCLLSSRGPDRIVKIADFGLSRDVFSNDFYQKHGRAFIAIKWMPPESFLDGVFNSKTDVWSFGVVLWEIFSMGFAPYRHLQNQEVMELVASGTRLECPIGTPAELYEIMLRCWNTELARPTFAELVKFFNQLIVDPEISMLPIPPLIQRGVAQNTPSSTSSNTRSSIPLADDVITQGTVSTTMASSMTESMNSAISMPTHGEGVLHNIFPAYIRRPLQELIDSRRARISFAGKSSQSSSHDDSTLHDTGSIRDPYNEDESTNWNQALPAPGHRPPLHFELTVSQQSITASDYVENFQRPLLPDSTLEDSGAPPSQEYQSPSYDFSSNSPCSSLSTTPGTPPPTFPRTKHRERMAKLREVTSEQANYANDPVDHQDSPVV